MNNRPKGDGSRGVTLHNHAAPACTERRPAAPPPIFNDNVILGNDISAK
jgi:hypothetical protein